MITRLAVLFATSLQQMDFFFSFVGDTLVLTNLFITCFFNLAQGSLMIWSTPAGLPSGITNASCVSLLQYQRLFFVRSFFRVPATQSQSGSWGEGGNGPPKKGLTTESWSVSSHGVQPYSFHQSKVVLALLLSISCYVIPRLLGQ